MLKNVIEIFNKRKRRGKGAKLVIIIWKKTLIKEYELNLKKKLTSSVAVTQFEGHNATK